MKFLCDEMMKRLARWLRAAGYDAVVAPDGTPDSELLRRARRERRLLITRDRKLLEHRDAAGVVVLVEGNSTEDNAAALASRIPINWLHAPFSRCLVCNVALDQARITPAAEIPGKVRERGLPIWTCPRCQRLYWEGSHVRRMRDRLRGWQKAAGAMQSPPNSGIL